MISNEYFCGDCFSFSEEQSSREISSTFFIRFKKFLQLCSLTNIQLGGMPKIAFDIMLIHYLQRKGLLPFVFEVYLRFIEDFHFFSENLIKSLICFSQKKKIQK